MMRKRTGAVHAKVSGVIFAAFACLVPFSFARAAPAFNSPADVKAITDIEAFIQAQVDIKTIISYYAPDAIVYDRPTPGVYYGAQQIYDQFAPQMVGIKSIKVGFPDMNIASDGTMACAAMQLTFSIVFKTGAKTSTEYRDIDVFRKINGKWEIVQSHLSYPAAPKTGKAVMDGPTEPVGILKWRTDTIQMPAVDPAQAKAELSDWMVADAHTASPEELRQFYGPDDNAIVYDAYYPGDIRGLRQIEDYYRPFFDTYKSVKPNIGQFHIDTDGLLGAIVSQQTMALTAAKDGRHSSLSFRQSDCLHRINGKWYSFFEMVSFPVDFKTGEAVTVSPAVSRH